jgi:hypothetical protein
MRLTVPLLDGYARDVTLRYATQYGARTMKSRLSSNRGQENWWLAIISLFKRPYQLVSIFYRQLQPLILFQNRDDIEDAELQSLQYIEGMPASVSGFKHHPMCAVAPVCQLRQLTFMKVRLDEAPAPRRSYLSFTRDRQI